MYTNYEPRTCRDSLQQNMKEQNERGKHPRVHDSGTFLIPFAQHFAVWQKGYQVFRDDVSITGINDKGVLNLVTQASKHDKVRAAREALKDLERGELVPVATKLSLFNNTSAKKASKELQRISAKAALNSDEFAKQYEAKTVCPVVTEPWESHTGKIASECKRIWEYSPESFWWFSTSRHDTFKTIMTRNTDVQNNLVFSGKGKNALTRRGKLFAMSVSALDKFKLDKEKFAKNVDELIGMTPMVEFDRMIRSGLVDIVPRAEIISDTDGKYHEILEDSLDDKYGLVIQRNQEALEEARTITIKIMHEISIMANKENKTTEELIMNFIEYKQWDFDDNGDKNEEVDGNDLGTTLGLVSSVNRPHSKHANSDATEFFAAMKRQADKIIDDNIVEHEWEWLHENGEKLKNMIYRTLSTCAQWSLATKELGEDFLETSAYKIIDIIWLDANLDHFADDRRDVEYREHREQGRQILQRYLETQFVSIVFQRFEMMKHKSDLYYQNQKKIEIQKKILHPVPEIDTALVVYQPPPWWPPMPYHYENHITNQFRDLKDRRLNNGRIFTGPLFKGGFTEKQKLFIMSLGIEDETHIKNMTEEANNVHIHSTEQHQKRDLWGMPNFSTQSYVMAGAWLVVVAVSNVTNMTGLNIISIIASIRSIKDVFYEVFNIFLFIPFSFIWECFKSVIAFVWTQGLELGREQARKLRQGLLKFAQSLKRRFDAMSSGIPTQSAGDPAQVWSKVTEFIQRAQEKIELLSNRTMPEEDKQKRKDSIRQKLDEKIQGFLEQEDLLRLSSNKQNQESETFDAVNLQNIDDVPIFSDRVRTFIDLTQDEMDELQI